MELSDLTYKEWTELLRAVDLMYRQDLRYANSQAGLRKAEFMEGVERLKGIGDRLAIEFRERSTRGEVSRATSATGPTSAE
jgi:hypothetical protein